MIALLDTSHDLGECAQELGCPVAQLLTPLTRFARKSATFAIDNGAFAGFDPKKFLSLLAREEEARQGCLFVAVPDVVANARRTLELFETWRYKLQHWPLALVMQDGQEDLEIPWSAVAAIFIGGSTAWKMSKAAADCVRAAKALPDSKWVHAGRVNTPGRFEYFEALGADSIDGTGLSRYSHMRAAILDAYENPGLFPVPSESAAERARLI
jgi:hypothetical protein